MKQGEYLFWVLLLQSIHAEMSGRIVSLTQTIEIVDRHHIMPVIVIFVFVIIKLQHTMLCF